MAGQFLLATAAFWALVAAPWTFLIISGILCALIASKRLFIRGNSPAWLTHHQLEAYLDDPRVLRVTCLSLALATFSLCFKIDGTNTFVFLARFFAPLLLVPLVLILSVASKKLLLRTQGANWQQRFFKTFWYDTTMLALMGTFLLAIGCVFFLPDGLGDWLTNWLTFSAGDAQMHGSHDEVLMRIDEGGYGASLRTLEGVDGSKLPALISFDLSLKAICTLICGFLFLPAIIRCSATLTTLARRLTLSLHMGTSISSCLEVLRLPVKKLIVKDAMPWLHNMSKTFWWLTGCYVVLFSLVAFCPGAVGVAILNWIDFALRDAGFLHLSTFDNPQLRLFVAAIVAMIGAGPLAVTACVFLPNLKSRELILNSEGFLLPNLHFFPFKMWSNVRSVSVLRHSKKTPWQKQTLSISFYSGGSLRLKLCQLSHEDLCDFLSAIDEHAESCSFSEEALEIRRNIGKINSVVPQESQFRGLPAENFRSTIFVPFSPGERLAGKEIRVIRQLSSKQLTAVYLVRMPDGQLAVAKQFCFPAESEQTTRLLKVFQREYELLSTLNHPRIAKVLDVIQHDAASYLILEFSKGRDLRDIVEKDGARDEQVAIEIAEQLCDAILHLHSQETPILHRDLTPDNIVMDEDRQIRLIDFGAAHQFLEGITGTLIGKQCYVAPEQLRGDANPRSDIYSFGCTLHYLLTGEDPIALSQCDPASTSNVSNAMRELVMACTEFDEEKRPQTFQEIQKELQQIKAGSSLVVRAAKEPIPVFRQESEVSK